MNFAINDSANVPLAQFREFRTNIPRFTLNEKAVHIDTLMLLEPMIRFDVKDSLHNFSNFVKNNTEDDTLVVEVQNTEQDTNTTLFTVNHLRILDAGLQYNDYSYAQPYQYNINKINLSKVKRVPKGVKRSSGFIGFAGHSDPVKFRNVRIKRL